MDEAKKMRRTRKKLILRDPEDADIHELCKRKKENGKGRKGVKGTSLDICQGSDVGGTEMSQKTDSTQTCEIGTKERKLNDGSATVEGKVHCEDKKEESLFASVRKAGNQKGTSLSSEVEVSSSGSTMKKSKTKKSRHRKDACENEIAVCFNATAEVLTNVFEEQSKQNGRKKKSKGDTNVVFKSPLLFDDDMLETIEESQQASDKRTEACVDVTNQYSNLEACGLNCSSVENVSEAAAQNSASGNCDDVTRCEEDGSIENGKKSRKKKEGRRRKKDKSESAVDVQLSDEDRPAETAFEKQTREKRRLEEEFVTKEERVTKDSESYVSSVTDPDRPLAEKHHKTKTNKKRKTKDDGDHVAAATSLPSENLQDNIPLKTMNKTIGVADHIAKDSESYVSSVTDPDGPLAEKHHKTKMNKKGKTKNDGDHVVVATSQLSESPRGSSTLQTMNKTIGISLNCDSVEHVRETAAENLASRNHDNIPRCEDSIENGERSSKKKEGRKRKQEESGSAVECKLAHVEKPAETAVEKHRRKKRSPEEEHVTKDSASCVNSTLTDPDIPLAEKHRNTKTNKKNKTKADGNHVDAATSQPTGSLQSKSPLQTTNKTIETGGDGEGVPGSPKKNGGKMRAADHVDTIQEENVDQVTGSFWLKPASTGACFPRPNKNLFRRKMRCPVPGCLGRSTRINRHILDCHPELEASEREKLVEKIMENPGDFLGAVPSAPVVPVLKRKLRCPVDGCLGMTIRLRRHLVNCHLELTPAEREELWEKVSRNPMEYLCAPTKLETSEIQEIPIAEVTRQKKSSAGIPRPNFKVYSRRRKQDCIVSGCHGAAINMRRHLVDCHSDLADKHEELLQKLIERRREERAAKKEALKHGGTNGVPSDTTDSVASEDEGH